MRQKTSSGPAGPQRVKESIWITCVSSSHTSDLRDSRNASIFGIRSDPGLAKRDLNKVQRKDIVVNEREINMSACKREKEITDIIQVVGVKTLTAPLTSLL